MFACVMKNATHHTHFAYYVGQLLNGGLAEVGCCGIDVRSIMIKHENRNRHI